MDNKCPEGMPYGQWLKEKNISIQPRAKELVHTDTGLPMQVHNAFVNKPHELYDRNLARQGKKIDPEDM